MSLKAVLVGLVLFSAVRVDRCERKESSSLRERLCELFFGNL